ncbi:MAG: hypothetical protein M3317_09015 [Actinomycetota bacterium]|nr:hypothetical protein [Actinomycetota bacterium]
MAPVADFLWYSLWFSIVCLVTILWFVAMSDIRDHARKDLFKSAELTFMAVAVSIVAAGSIAAAGAVVRDRWVEVGSKGTVSAAAARPGCGDYFTFTYSFIPERMVREIRNCTDNPAESLH